MKTQLKVWGIRLALLALPFIASADGDIDSLIMKVTTTLKSVIGVLFVLLFIYFLWGVIQYVMAGGDAEKIKTGRDHMIWGIIGMAVCAAAWGLVKLIVDYFGAGGQAIPTGTGTF